MRYYLVDEISEPDMQKLRKHLNNTAIKSGLDDMYWVELPGEFLTRTQADHASCRPHVFGLELGKSYLKAELFVRNRNHFGCSCQQYCDDRQSGYVINLISNMINGLNLRT